MSEICLGLWVMSGVIDVIGLIYTPRFLPGILRLLGLPTLAFSLFETTVWIGLG